MFGGFRWVVWLGIGAVALTVGILAGERVGFDVSKLTQPVWGPVWVWLGYGRVETNELLEFGRDQVGKPEPSTPQKVIGAFEGIYSIYEQVGGRRTNFQNVLTYPENSSIRRLSHGVARLDLSLEGADKARACTAFLISDTYALTAGHCFMKESACSTTTTTSSDLVKLKPIEVKGADGSPIKGSAFLIFRYFGNEQGGHATENVVDPIPVTAVKGEVRCEKGLDYAIVELPKGAIEKSRKEQKAEISPVFLGDVKIEPGHQLLILHHPDGRSLMATERHCLAADPPDRDDGYFAHYCDTLGGSSGAPVFSRDHEVVVGIHLKSQIDPKTAGEENAALRISKIVANSPLLKTLNILVKDPLTGEQQKLLDLVTKRGQEAHDLVSVGREADALHLLSAASKHIRSPKDWLIAERSPEFVGALMETSLLRRELSRFFAQRGSRSQIAFMDGTKPIAAVAGKTGLKVVNLNDLTERNLVRNGDDTIGSLLLSKDGRRVAAQSNDQVSAWDTVSGNLLNSFSTTGSIVAISNDGKRILMQEFGPINIPQKDVASQVSTLTVRDLDSDLDIAHIEIDIDKFDPDKFAFDNFGARILLGSSMVGAMVWDVSTNTQLRFPEAADATLGADGTVATLSGGGVLSVYSPGRSTPVCTTKTDFLDVSGLVFSRSVKSLGIVGGDVRGTLFEARFGAADCQNIHLSRVAIEDGDRTISKKGDAISLVVDRVMHLFHFDGAENFEQTTVGLEFPNSNLVFDERGERFLLAAVSDDTNTPISLWRSDAPALVKNFKSKTTRDNVVDLVWNSKIDRLSIVTFGGLIHGQSITSGVRTFTVSTGGAFLGARAPSYSVEPASILAAILQKDGRVLVVDQSSGKKLRYVALGSGEKICSLAQSSKRNLLAIGGCAGTLFLYDTKTWSERHDKVAPSAIAALALISDGETVAFVAKGELQLRRAGDLSLSGSIPVEIGNPRMLFASPNSQYVVVQGLRNSVPSANNKSEAVVVDLKRSQRLFSIAGVSNFPSTSSATFSQDSRMIAFPMKDGSALVYDLQRGQLVAHLLHDGTVSTSVAFDPRGKILAVGRRNGSIQFWRRTDFALLASISVERLGRSGVESLSFNESGELLAIGDRNGGVSIVAMPGDDEEALQEFVKEKLRLPLSEDNCAKLFREQRFRHCGAR